MSFFYNHIGDIMKIYVDLVLGLNLGFDFLLLLTTALLLKRTIKIYRLLLGAFVGSLSTLCLFFSTTSLQLFLVKILISVFMIIISFSYCNKKYFMKNFITLYMVSILLGGFLYFLNIQFSYKNEGMVFFHNGLSVNVWFLIICSPIILYVYVKHNKINKTHYRHYHQVTIYLKDKIIKCTGYLDTGNKVVDPYFHRSVLLVNENVNVDKSIFTILVPYYTIGNQGILYCANPNKIEIDGLEYKALIGISKENIDIDGVDCILPNIIEEEIC